MKNLQSFNELGKLDESGLYPSSKTNLTPAELAELHSYEANPKNPELLALEKDDIRSVMLLVSKLRKEPLKAMLLYKDILALHPEWQLTEVVKDNKHRWPNPDIIILSRLVVSIAKKS
jgi:hypothetical protein